ncbi:hypothetical protein [Chondromyces apiculatus]|uniref:Uncharacterized protein n=1 Tax=Chondromyces apiculatus DSM 436 TaxID=1192034 RepID=A0A017TE38_9BACT|nr:hypothetical protein [Chondromyces apiculatus]EYF07065.1 Hypothetical protein CAP_1324 [Chondromyces apiculatus DSM 436]
MRVRTLLAQDPSLEGVKYCLTLADERFVVCASRPHCLPAVFGGTAEELTLLLSGPITSRAAALAAMPRSELLDIFPRGCECGTDHGRQALSLRECFEVCGEAVRQRLRDLEAKGGRVTWDMLRCLRDLWAKAQGRDPQDLESAQLILIETAQTQPVRYSRHARPRRRAAACIPPRRVSSGGGASCVLAPAAQAGGAAVGCRRPATLHA